MSPSNTSAPADIAAIAGQFDIPGRFVAGGPYGSGHINETHAVTFEQDGVPRGYIFQKLNERIFKDVAALMDNITRVTRHLRGKVLARGGDPVREALTVIPTRDGRSWLRSPAGDAWRAYIFIERARTFDVLSEARQAFEAARAFGRFQIDLADLPGPPLNEIIPFFHHTPRRLATLEQAIAADVANRAATCRAEIDFVRERAPLTSHVVSDLEAGRLPARVTHNDTKINNVMLDADTGAGICVIDLDTVMPGSILYDFGDEVRTSVGHFAENERDLSKVSVDLAFFEQLVAGYLEATRASLTARELDRLAFAGILITLTIGIRFLTDYLQGDVYFRTHRDGENLDRARTQLALVRRLEDSQEKLEAVVARYR